MEVRLCRGSARRTVAEAAWHSGSRDGFERGGRASGRWLVPVADVEDASRRRGVGVVAVDARAGRGLLRGRGSRGRAAAECFSAVRGGGCRPESARCAGARARDGAPRGGQGPDAGAALSGAGAPGVVARHEPAGGRRGGSHRGRATPRVGASQRARRLRAGQGQRVRCSCCLLGAVLVLAMRRGQSTV